MSNIYLLRHGQTAWNKDSIYRGQHDIPLDDHGLAQAQCASRLWDKIKFTHIYSSPLSRAMQTARPTADKLALQITETPELIDIDYGQWTGKPARQIEQDYPQLNREWLESPDTVSFPQGESLSAVRDRAFPKLLDIARAAKDQAVLLVSHRVVLKVLVCVALEMPLSKFWQVQLDTASLTVLSFDRDLFTLRRLNDTCHLSSLPCPTDAVDF